jgi:RNA polymerase sigma factor for flagellar operon FliA
MSRTSAALKKYGKNQGPNNLSQEEKDNLILEYAPVVKMIANKIASRLPPSIQLDDLISAGILGLMDALEKWDPSRETKLKTYAEFRIRGAMLDELRAQDWIPRSVRDKAKLVERAIKKLEADLERIPTDEEIAAFMQMSLEEFHKIMLEIRPVSVLSIDEAALNDNEKKSLLNLLEAAKINSPLFQLNFKAVKKIIAESIEELPEKMRFVLSLYYYEDLNFREIAEIMQVTESRVSQLHAAAVLRLRARVSECLEVTDLEIA